MDIYANVKYNKPEELFAVVNGRFISRFPVKMHQFVGLRDRTTSGEKSQKAHKIKEKWH